MRILVTGANGFIGAHLAAGLAAAGHRVVACARDAAAARRQFPGHEWIACDFNRDVEAETWRARLDGVEAVVNCAGILQGSRGQSIDAIHRRTPIALFDACAGAGVRRVIQVSALGVEPGVEPGEDTDYARTKRAADAHLMGLDLDWIVLRPSLVIAPGSYGGTSLLRGLAGFPLVTPLAGGGAQVFQPILMSDLARAVARLVEPDAPARLVVAAVGPEPMDVREIVARLRAWLGFRPARPVAVPMGLMRLAARAGDAAGYLGRGGPLRTTALAQMARPNVADAAAFAETVGFAPRALAEGLAADPSRVQDRWHARLVFLRPVLRVALALLLIGTGVLAAKALLMAPPDPAGSLREAWDFDRFRAALAPLLWFIELALGLLGAPLLFAWRVRQVCGAACLLAVMRLAVLLAWYATSPLWLLGLPPIATAFLVVTATLAVAATADDR